MSQTNLLTFRLRVTSIFLIAAGYGWAGGHFIPAGSPFVAYLFQGVILLVLLILSTSSSISRAFHMRGGRQGIAYFLPPHTLLINIANIIRGFTNTGANTFGSHNTPDDLVPICMILIGDILWLGSFFGGKKIN